MTFLEIAHRERADVFYVHLPEVGPVMHPPSPSSLFQRLWSDPAKPVDGIILDEQNLLMFDLPEIVHVQLVDSETLCYEEVCTTPLCIGEWFVQRVPAVRHRARDLLRHRAWMFRTDGPLQSPHVLCPRSLCDPLHVKSY